MKQQHAKKVLDAMLGIMKKAQGREGNAAGAVSASSKPSPRRTARAATPQTGEEITLDSHDVLAFRISRKFKAAMNSEQ